MLYQTHAKILLQNIRQNIEGIRKQVGKDRKILIAVKANAYGHGAIQVSKMAEKMGVEWLGVATVPEAIELRKAGIKLPILKFSPAFQEEMEAAVENDITLTVCQRENIDFLNKISEKSKKKSQVHLKIDSGMGRIGCHIDEAQEISRHIEKNCSSLQLEGVFTHLPVSDEANKSYTQRQISVFKKVVENIQNSFGTKIPLVHAANSGGILAHEETWLNMVRPGIMIYGFYPSQQTPQTIPLKPGLSFLTKVSFLKKVSKGTSIGYGRTWIAPEDSWIATFPAGYADGFNRLFSNQGRVLIKGVSYPVVGRVCMDQSMANLGPATNVVLGDEVVLIGKSGSEEISAEEWAKKLGTITYEVTCQINSRVQRYFEE
ncbi:MAG: alanine racemase [Candidatus Riflebacteria bacterium]|nr:alanine racemase [Candidatus Riflebacteria bacterium]